MAAERAGYVLYRALVLYLIIKRPCAPSDPKPSIIAPTVAVACSLPASILYLPKGIGIHNVSELLCNTNQIIGDSSGDQCINE